MPSFDVVSRVEMQEVDNAISNSMKEIGQRYDFKGSASKLERTEGGIILLSEDEMKAKQVLDILISNAAMLGKLTPLHHYDPSTWDNVINLNLIANQRLIRSFDPLLRQANHGRAIFLSATVARVATPYWGAYATSKSGLEMMIQVYAKETEKTNLKVNIVDPGITKTSLRASAFPGEDPSKLKSPKRLVPLFLKLCSAENQAHGQLIKYDEYDKH